MQRLTITLMMDPAYPTGGSLLEKRVKDFIYEWHAEDNLQEVLNMALMANNIPANVIKVGGPTDTLAFLVQPYPAPNKGNFKKTVSGFSSSFPSKRY